MNNLPQDYSIVKSNLFRLFSRVLFMTTILAASGCGSSTDTMADLPDETIEEFPHLIGGDIESAEQRLGELSFEEPVVTHSETDIFQAKYAHIDPGGIVPATLRRAALAYYDSNLSRISNRNYLSVIDFRQHSSRARFYIINMNTGSVWAIRTSHGKGSDRNHNGYAEAFSNVSGSGASSLGYYLTAETYYGAHGLSLRLDGLSSTNSNARRRAVVIHGASYVVEASVRQGRSLGCPAIATPHKDRVIQLLKGGSLIYAGRS